MSRKGGATNGSAALLGIIGKESRGCLVKRFAAALLAASVLLACGYALGQAQNPSADQSAWVAKVFLNEKKTKLLYLAVESTKSPETMTQQYRKSLEENKNCPIELARLYQSAVQSHSLSEAALIYATTRYYRERAADEARGIRPEMSEADFRFRLINAAQNQRIIELLERSQKTSKY